MNRNLKIVYLIYISALLVPFSLMGTDFSDQSFLIAEVNNRNFNSQRTWSFIDENPYAGLEIDLEADQNNIYLQGTDTPFSTMLEKINSICDQNESRLVPVFLNYDQDVLLLDSLINNSGISEKIFYLPQGEAWPTIEYLIQSNRRIIFFVEGKFVNQSRVVHPLQNYALQIQADQIAAGPLLARQVSRINLELFKIDGFENLPTATPPSRLSRNLVPDYINYLLENWKKVGKKPNFIFVGNEIFNFDFIIGQINSFAHIRGRVRTAGKNLEKVYWKNPDVVVTGGRFSFPYRGGEEMILSPFAPGYQMTPEQIVITTEMAIPDEYSILANPLILGEGMTAGFSFEGTINNMITPDVTYEGRNYSFVQDIDRGQVLRLTENASVNIGDPRQYKLPNSSFTVCCFVKFTEILEYGDNAILGNSESGYRRGMHLILRSGRPYFGLWANDFMSDELIANNEWVHLTWRYILETGEQAIFVNGQYAGSSDGHPPYSGTSDIHIGSAFSQGASLRGYIDNLYIWNRPLSNEEINRLSLDEEIRFEESASPERDLKTSVTGTIALITAGLLLLSVIAFMLIKLYRKRKGSVILRESLSSKLNQILLFGEFTAVDSQGDVVTELFTPKVKELFLFVLIKSLKSGIGVPIPEVNRQLWEGIDADKVANNRAVTLNKLRKILARFSRIEILSSGGYLQLKIHEPFFCDYIEAFKLCQIPEGLTRTQLERFFVYVKKGRLLKGTDWNWLDEVRGYTGNQVTDNLLKLASFYKKENKTREVDKVAQRIIDYDDLNEEAVFLQIWALQKTNNVHLANYHYNAFCKKYEENMGESYSMTFADFTTYYSEKL